MCPCYNCSNCIRDETKSSPNTVIPTSGSDKDQTVEIGILQLPETLYHAICVFNGRYGTGEDRVKNLTALGLDARAVQDAVNMIAPLFDKMS